MKVVITGVSGFLGSEMARRFAQEGHAVSGLSRRPPAGLALAAHFQAGLGQAAPQGAFGSADLVIHMAHDRSAGAQELNVSGTKLWAEQARQEGAVRQVFLTSVSAHHDAPSEYGRAKALLEGYFKGTGAVLVRPGLVVGDGGSYGDMARLIRRFPIVPVLGGDRLQVVLTDLDSLFRTLLKAPRLEAGKAYNLFQPDWVGLLSLARAIRAESGHFSLFLPVPLAPAMGLLSLGQAIGLPKTLGPESLKNLLHCRSYGYQSSYGELGLPILPLAELLARHG